MCGDPDTCADIELNDLVVRLNRTPCAMTPTCAVMDETLKGLGGMYLTIRTLKNKKNTSPAGNAKAITYT